MELKNAVPWGRSLKEYCEIFSLSETDLKKKILGCSDGPASFNAELTALGGDVISFDPIYRYETEDIRSRIDEVYSEVIDQVSRNLTDFLWESIVSVEELGEIRMSAMDRFLHDYDLGKSEGRYLAGALPDLPFEAESFELALCSHFLFLYSEQFSYEFHRDALTALLQRADEVRVFPLVNLRNEISPYLERFLSESSELGVSAELVDVAYRFQKGATQMLVLHKREGL